MEALKHKPCNYQFTQGGCKKGAACDFRHAVVVQKVMLPPKGLSELRSSNLFEFAPTRDNEKIEHDACSQYYGRVQDAAGVYPGMGPHIQMILFETTTHRPLIVVVFDGSVCLE